MNSNPTGQTQLSVILDQYESRKGGGARFAAIGMDWNQVVLNGGPPCFHICDDQHFCGRSERWHGEPGFHGFVSLADLITEAKADNAALVKALRFACERIGYFSDLYCGMNDMTGRNALAEIAAILTNSSTAPSVPRGTKAGVGRTRRR